MTFAHIGAGVTSGRARATTVDRSCGTDTARLTVTLGKVGPEASPWGPRQRRWIR